MPSRKWWTATLLGAGTQAVAQIQAGWVEATKITLVGLVVQRLVAWLTPNERS